VLAARRGREAPLEVIFVLLRKWPEFVLPHRPQQPRRINRLRGKVKVLIDKLICRRVAGHSDAV
jgi:hypothetical protein